MVGLNIGLDCRFGVDALDIWLGWRFGWVGLGWFGNYVGFGRFSLVWRIGWVWRIGEVWNFLLGKRFDCVGYLVELNICLSWRFV